MNKIASYCSFKDIHNLRTTGIPSCINEVYSYQIKEFNRSLKKWMKSAPEESEGNYALAVKIIMNCIKDHSDYLDLSDLHLDSLPDLSRIDYLKRLDYRGNNPKEIRDCFTYLPKQDATLKDSSKLPKGIEYVKYDHSGPAFEDIRDDYHMELIRLSEKFSSISRSSYFISPLDKSLLKQL